MSRSATGARVRGWSPTWAVVVSAVGALAVLPVLVLALSLIVDDLGSTGEKFDGMGLALGGVALVPVAATLLPLAWFWWRGGKVAFWIGLVAAVVLGAGMVWSGFTFSA